MGASFPNATGFGQALPRHLAIGRWRQEEREEKGADRHQGATPQGYGDAPMIGDPPQGRDAKAGCTHREPDDQAGRHAEITWHIGLSEDDGDGERRYQDEPEQSQHNETPHARDEEESDS